jgi:hypothetical protein
MNRREELEQQVWEQVWDSVWYQVEEDMSNPVYGQIESQVQWKVLDRVWAQVLDPVPSRQGLDRSRRQVSEQAREDYNER